MINNCLKFDLLNSRIVACTNNKMNIHIEQTDSIFDGMICKEPIDPLVLHKLINSDLLLQVMKVNKQYANEKQMLMCYNRLIKNGYAHILYNKTEYGRAKAKGGLSLLNIRREIRHTLTDDTMIDLDIDCCHHVLMSQMLHNYGFDCKHLRSYVNNRTEWFDLVRKHWGIDILHEGNPILLKEIPKYLFIRLLYHGGIKGWIKDYKLPNKQIPNKLQDFIDEIAIIGQIFKEQNPELYISLNKKKILKNKVNNDGDAINTIGSLCSTIMQEKENMLLETIYEYLVLTKCIENNVVSLCADGIMISKNKYYPSLLKEMTTWIYLKTGFKVNMSHKPMIQGYHNIENNVINHIPYKPPSDFKFVDNVYNRMDELLKQYKQSKYFDVKLRINKINKREKSIIKLTSRAKHDCILCKSVHKTGNCWIRIDQNESCYFHCNKKSKLIHRSVKDKEFIRACQIDTMNNTIDNFFKLDLSNIDVIKEESKYIGCDINNKFIWKEEYNNKFIILNAHMGKGKTLIHILIE